MIFLCFFNYAQNTVGLHNGIGDFVYGGNISLAKLLVKLFYAETKIFHAVLQYFSVLYDNNGIAANYVPNDIAFQHEYREEYLQYNQYEYGQQPAEKGLSGILHGDHRQVGDQHSDYQLAGLKLTDLPFTHNTNGENDSCI